MKPVYLLFAAMTVAGVAGALASDRSEPPRIAEEPRPLPASAVQSLGDPHAGMEMDQPLDDVPTEDDMQGEEMPDDDIHRGMR